MSVGTFDPSAGPAKLDVTQARALLDAVADIAVSELNAEQVAEFAPLVSHQGWSDVAEELASVEIEALIRTFTLGEMCHTALTADAKSAVIPLVRVLKQRGEYDKALTKWIKTNTDNKFLPHGSLMDRL